MQKHGCSPPLFRLKRSKISVTFSCVQVPVKKYKMNANKIILCIVLLMISQYANLDIHEIAIMKAAP